MSVYQDSELMRERSFKALNDPTSVPNRRYDRYGAVDQLEASLDALNYFTAPDNKKAMEDEFLEDLHSSEWGISSEATACYLEAVKSHQNGNTSDSLTMLHDAVRSYMADAGVSLPQGEEAAGLSQPNVISVREVGCLINLNRRSLEKHLHRWMEQRGVLSQDGIYLKRGKGTSLPLDTSQYQEEKWIASYSLSVSVAESFANKDKLSIKNILHLEYAEAAFRVLIFTPFLPGVHADEVEFGLIPFAAPRMLKKLETEGEYEEFLILTLQGSADELGDADDRPTLDNKG